MINYGLTDKVAIVTGASKATLEALTRNLTS